MNTSGEMLSPAQAIGPSGSRTASRSETVPFRQFAPWNEAIDADT